MPAALVRWLRRTGTRWVRRRATEAGYAAIMVAVIVPTLGIGLCAVAVDTGMWYAEMQKAQKAADAAALAGVPYLPQDFASAKTRALEVADRNGYNNTGTNSVTVEPGDKATQLRVTISSTIKNTFGSALGFKTQTVTRSGTADYQGPAPMGSPCNTFGNEPDAGGGAGSATPTGTARGTSPYSNCSRTPQFWATVEGPGTGKLQGDRYQTKNCDTSTGIDGCSGTTNSEYDDFGYTFLVRVSQALVDSGSLVEVQLYDPMFVETGNTCANLPVTGTYANDTTLTNPYVKNNDARNRYAEDGPSSASFCTGDYFPGGGSDSMTTSFVLRQQSDSTNAAAAPVQNDVSGPACIKQYGSYNASSSSFPKLLQQGQSGYNDEIASQFHNWVKFCKFKPTRAGDYYLQVRTNVSLGGSGSGYIRTGNTAAAALTGNTSTGEGDNSFAVRAVASVAGQEKNVAVSGYNHMPIFVNYTAATASFNLIRVLPGAAGQKISFSYFDAGDSNSAGSVQVSPPAATTNGQPDATGSVLTTPFPGGCSAYGGSAGGSQTAPTALTNCTAPFVKNGSSGQSKNNGKTETIIIPIPNDYNCNYNSPAGCWYKVTLNYGNTSTSTVNDITTWDATIIGDPVRLIK